MYPHPSPVIDPQSEVASPYTPSVVNIALSPSAGSSVQHIHDVGGPSKNENPITFVSTLHAASQSSVVAAAPLSIAV